MIDQLQNRERQRPVCVNTRDRVAKRIPLTVLKESLPILLETQAEQLQQTATTVCPTCNTSVEGKFCGSCGEQILVKPDYSFRGLFSETISVVTNLESNIFRSFASLLTKPGLLTAEYFLGRRKRYLKPLQLFIFCNIIFFFVQAFTEFNALRTPLRAHLFEMPYGQLARKKVGEVMAQRGVTYKEYEARFNPVIETQAKTLVFLMLPIFALGLKLLYLRKREYFVKHLVFGTHFFSYYLLLCSIFYLFIVSAPRFLRTRVIFTDLVMTAVILLICLTYLLLAARRVYNERWLISTLRAFGMIVVLALTVQTFRLILFVTAFYLV